MNIYSVYSFNQFVPKKKSTHWIQHHHITTTETKENKTMKRKRECGILPDNGGKKRATLSAIDHFQNDLDHLFYEWNTINIVLESIRNAFAITQDSTEEHLDEVDRELSIAYDDLMAQVRHLERQLKRMTNEIYQKLIVQQEWDRQSSSSPTLSAYSSVTKHLKQ